MKKRILALALGLGLLTVPASAAASAPPASYTTPSGLTIQVTRPAVTSLGGTPTYLGDGVFQVREDSGVYGLYDINATFRASTQSSLYSMGVRWISSPSRYTQPAA